MDLADVFAGVRVVELAQFVFVPGAGALLADHGAEVIKIEPPGGGDPYRTLKIADGRITKSANLALEQNNRGKRSLAVDLKSDAGREVFFRLIKSADVFLTSLRPKAIDRLGFGVEALRAHNPKLIYVRGNGVGFKGKDADKAGYDASAYWARGGFADILNPPGADSPLRPRPALGDHTGSISVAYGVASALFRREKTGQALVVEASLLSTAMWVLSADIAISQTQTPTQMSVINNEARYPLVRSYKTRDGRFIQLMFLDPDRYWPPLCKLLGQEELLKDPRFSDSDLRVENGGALAELITKTIGARDWEEWRPLFEAWDAPWELVQTVREVASDPQARDNGYLFDIEVADGTSVRLISGPVGFDGHTAPKRPRRAPHLGEDTDDILAGLGISDDERARLRAAAVIA
jgi:crotonobetainyl-CoA:carnitine CoA-transferase CaiB-like acyl-CoA transferase